MDSLPGQLAEVLIRPDDLIYDESSPRRATVVGRAFRGAEYLYTLRLASGTRVLCLVPSHHQHAIGDEIGIRLEARHLVVFPRPESDAGEPWQVVKPRDLA